MPGEGGGPVVEGLEGEGVVLVEGGLELVGQGGALLDEGDLVAAEEPQLHGGRVQGAQGPPGVAVGAQGVGAKDQASSGSSLAPPGRLRSR